MTASKGSELEEEIELLLESPGRTSNCLPSQKPLPIPATSTTKSATVTPPRTKAPITITTPSSSSSSIGGDKELDHPHHFTVLFYLNRAQERKKKETQEKELQLSQQRQQQIQQSQQSQSARDPLPTQNSQLPTSQHESLQVAQPTNSFRKTDKRTIRKRRRRTLKNRQNFTSQQISDSGIEVSSSSVIPLSQSLPQPIQTSTPQSPPPDLQSSLPSPSPSPSTVASPKLRKNANVDPELLKTVKAALIQFVRSQNSEHPLLRGTAKWSELKADIERYWFPQFKVYLESQRVDCDHDMIKRCLHDLHLSRRDGFLKRKRAEKAREEKGAEDPPVFIKTEDEVIIKREEDTLAW